MNPTALFRPRNWWRRRVRVGVNALGITDHDTFAGYDQALSRCARGRARIDLRHRAFDQAARPFRAPAGIFSRMATAWAISATWVLDMQASRRDRNMRLVARLQELGFDITLEEAEARGRGMTGRPALRADHGGEGLRLEPARRHSTSTWTNPPRATSTAASRRSRKACSEFARRAGSRRWRIRCA